MRLGGEPSVSASQTISVLIRFQGLAQAVGDPGDIVFDVTEFGGDFGYNFDPLSVVISPTTFSARINAVLEDIFSATNASGHAPTPTLPDGTIENHEEAVVIARRYGYVESSSRLNLFDPDDVNLQLQLTSDLAITLPSASLNASGITIDSIESGGAITIDSRTNTSIEEIYHVYSLEYASISRIQGRRDLLSVGTNSYVFSTDFTVTAASNSEADTVIIGGQPGISFSAAPTLS